MEERFNIIRETRADSDSVWFPTSQLQVTLNREEMAFILGALGAEAERQHRKRDARNHAMLVDISAKIVQTLI